jgi:hypothetical protein
LPRVLSPYRLQKAETILDGEVPRVGERKRGKSRERKGGRKEGGKDGTLPCRLRELLDRANAA